MYSVLDIARFIINYANRRGFVISNLKLQKILYFVQAFFLVNSHGNTPCFDEEIEAWDFGPVVPIVYHEFKQFGSGPIPVVERYVSWEDRISIWNARTIEFNENIIAPDDRHNIELVVDEFSQYSAYQLVQLTHKQSPWIDAFRNASQGTNVISKDSIFHYFHHE